MALEEAGPANGADRAKRIVAAGIHGVILAMIARSSLGLPHSLTPWMWDPCRLRCIAAHCGLSGILTLAISHALAGQHCFRCFPCASVGLGGQTWLAFIERDMDLDAGCGLGQAKIAGPDANASKHTSAGDDSISCGSSCSHRVCISCFDPLHTTSREKRASRTTQSYGHRDAVAALSCARLVVRVTRAPVGLPLSFRW